MSLFNNPNKDSEKFVHSDKKIMGRYFRAALDCVLDIFFPSICPGCGKNVTGGQVVCFSCFENIPINKSLFCGSCGARLPENKKICHLDFPYILGVATTYKNETARNLIRELKFGFIKNASSPLAELLIAYAESIGIAEDDWIVVPIPLGKKRLRQRGFNQATAIAEIFAGHYSLAVEKEGFVRHKETKPQTEMKNFESRVENAGGCFSVTAPEKFAGRNIILIDDVSTSGATFFEAATSLKKSGAKKIVALAAAKG